MSTRPLLSSLCSRLPTSQHVHGALGQAPLISLRGVLLGLFDRIPTEDRHELMRSRTVVRGNGRARLAQSVRRTVVVSDQNRMIYSESVR